jgi:hypothetical protein
MHAALASSVLGQIRIIFCSKGDTLLVPAVKSDDGAIKHWDNLLKK